MEKTVANWFTILLALTGFSCGPADFTSGTPPQISKSGEQNQSPIGKKSSNKDFPAPEDPDQNDSPESSDKSIFWTLACSGDKPIQPPTTVAAIVGPGDHTIDLGPNETAQVEIRGMPCQKLNKPRDILFMIDVSGSMDDNDPKIGDNCGRLRAVETVIDHATASDVRFALLTFNRKAKDTSLDYYELKEDLFDDLKSGAKVNQIADVICADGGGTDYKDGLLAAQQLISDSTRSNSQIEILLVSDGEPDNGKAGTGIAQELKDSGVIIGTVMLDGDDSVLEQSISSRDAAGKSFHVTVNQSDQLAIELQKLAQSFGATSGKLRYRTSSASPWTTIVINSLSQFTTGKIPLSLQLSPDGLELEYEFFDPQLDSKIVQYGKLHLEQN